MSRDRLRRPDAGFTLIEVLVALAVLAIVLPSIGMVIATSMRGSRSVEDRLALASTVETLLAELPDRTQLRPGSTSGQTNGLSWRIDVAPLPVLIGNAVAVSPWSPFAVTIRAEARGGQALRVDTVRLLQRTDR